MNALNWITSEAKKLRKQYPKRFATWREYVAQASAIYATKHGGKSPVGKKRNIGAVKKADKKQAVKKSEYHKDIKSHNVNIKVMSGNKISAKDFTRISNDINGNPRYVIHYLSVADNYDKAVKIANKIGGKKFHNKQYGGGIAFQSYNIDDTAKKLQNLIDSQISGYKKTVRKGKKTTVHYTKIGNMPKYKDAEMARELQLYAESDSGLYFQQRRPILINLGKKYKKGIFDTQKAAKLWRYFIDNSLKKYNKEFGSKRNWHELMSVNDRNLLAYEMAVETKDEFDLGNFHE